MSDTAVTHRASPEIGIAVGVSLLAIAAMAVDHLFVGHTPDRGDVFTFLLSSSLSLILAAMVFGIVVPRAKAVGADRAAKRGLACSLLSVLALPSLWIGLPFPLAGGGVALGLIGRAGQRRRLATAAIVIGSTVLLLGASAYIGEAISELS
jgi:hypothetical protein